MALRLAVGTAVAMLGVFGLAIAGCDQSEEFTPAAWQKLGPDNGCDPDNDRRWMVDDLLENHLRQGMSRAQVQQLLGPPDRLGNSTRKSTGWSYDIGQSFSDCDHVYVGFDRRGRLIQWFSSADS